MRPVLGAALTLLAALGATATAAAGAATANAATADTFSVVSAGAASGNADQLTVVVDSPSTITGIVATLSPQSSGGSTYSPALTLSSSETDPADSTQTQTTWTTTSIPAGTSPNGLALGNYNIDLTATYSDATSSTVTDAGTYGFHLTEAVTLTADNTNTAYPNIWVTFSGQVTLTYPDGTADTNTADYTGSTVILDQTSGQSSGLLGGAAVSGNGTFTVGAFWPQSAQTWIARVSTLVDEEYGADSNPVALTVTTVTPTLTVTSKPATVTYGKAAVVTGTLTYPTGTTQAPVAGETVWVSTKSGNTGGTARFATTDANGHFSVSLPSVGSAAELYVGTSNDHDLNAVQVPFTVNVVHPTTVGSLSVKLDQYWDLSVKGCVAFLSGDTSHSFTSTAGLELQYQVPVGSSWSAWKNLAAIPANEKTTHCGTGGTQFTDTLNGKAPENYARYRVIYKGTTGATSYAPSASAAVLAWRYADRIASYKVSEKTVSGKHVLTFTGVLQYYASGKWHNYSGQDLELNLEYKNKWYYWTKTIKTNSKGQFSYKLNAPGTATWNMEFLGNNSSPVGHLACGTPNKVIKV